ncbi:E3 SUMO-protein ligase PIAS2 isoform X3 [Folsomia candida]|uniref:E3 SUMO-protein ligase PIAS2 isoform X3 n=1 Tax=Folsomia candida TaxID=158441 RepID=UPI00160557F3|nr:E3 SUMO-protein ligase PIAS2 isoform X3 [Folsomia candida]
MDSDLRNMVMSFRVTELQTLLAYAGKNRSGRKNELQARSLELVKNKSSPIVSKIKELYRSTQQTMSMAGQTSGNMANSYAMSNGIPHTQTRLYTTSSAFGGASDKVLQGITSAFMFNAQKSQPQISMPICPDVKMKRLPFYDVTSELIKPSSLMPQAMNRSQEASFPFCLTPQQASDISESREYVAGTLGDQKLQYTVQVQLRFCSLDTSSKEQDDQFPPNLVVKVNSKVVPLPHPIPSNRPGVEPKRPSRPLNITSFVRLSPTTTNTITVGWASDSSRGYALCVYLVKKMTSLDLLTRLKQKGPRPADYSRGLIKELCAKDDGDCMVAMSSLKVSIACPLGKCRMSLPCRATTCKHLQCFDANLFLQMNERKPSWVCPVCDKPTLFEDLSIDGYFQEVISKMSNSESMDVELLPDGSWKTMSIKLKKEKEECSPPTKKMKPDSSKMNQTINLDDDDVEESIPVPKCEPNVTVPPPQTESRKEKDSGPAVCIDLTLSSDEESDDIPVIRPRRKTGKKPNYVIEDDSSSSSSSGSTTDGSQGANNAVPSPVAPSSPACITLDSRSPSPADPPPSRSETSNHHSTTGSSSSASTNRCGGSFSSISRNSMSVSSSSAAAVTTSRTDVRVGSGSSESVSSPGFQSTGIQPSGLF